MWEKITIRVGLPPLELWPVNEMNFRGPFNKFWASNKRIGGMDDGGVSTCVEGV